MKMKEVHDYINKTTSGKFKIIYINKILLFFMKFINKAFAKKNKYDIIIMNFKELK